MDQYTSKVNPWMMSTLVLAGILVGFGVAQIPYLKTLGGTAAVTPPAQQQPLEEPPPPALTADQIEKLPDDDTIIGDPNAPVTIVEFSDFECPFCSRFFTETLAQLDDEYIKTGKVKFVYRDFPIDSHPQAQAAAEVAECADEQGKFKEMHDLLFGNQSEWARAPQPMDVYKKYAGQVGLVMTQFTQCVTSKKYANEVRKDLVDGYTLGVTGTPGFFINGKPMMYGAVPYGAVFKPVLEAELAGKEWTVKPNPANPRQLIVEVK